ncbi:hypothetical protein WA026_002875 [Henosepilachna vigintioctopunctata]|uniref:Reverse transcriptase domain-containing protein n=1 Tax=Henosepilachna vigintioctopunctata TaxID=420089 RepID=A0AAW1TMH1_9CUCU
MPRQTYRPKSLHVAFWNANGLREKRAELQKFAARNEIDVILVNETHLRAADTEKIRNFVSYRNDRQDRRGGGTAIYVKSHLDHHVALTGDLVNMEATTVEINTASIRTLRLVSVYNPPNRRLLESDLDTIFSNNIATIAAGDLNAKHQSWNSRRANPSGNILRAFTDDRDLVVAGPPEPTHHSIQGLGDVLDIAILKEVTLPYRITSVSDLTSDHNPVLLFLGADPDEEYETQMKTTCWAAFKDHINETLPPLPPLRTRDQLEFAIEAFEEAIVRSIEACSREQRKPLHRNNPPEEVREIIRNRNRARRRHQRTWDPDHLRDYRRLAAEAKQALLDHQNAQWNAKLDLLEEEDHSLWRMTKILRNKYMPMPPIHGERGLVYTEAEKAEAFADYLETQFRVNYEDADLDNMERIENEVSRRLRSEDDRGIRPTTTTEIQHRINRSKTRKAPLRDGISNRALKQLPVRAIGQFTSIVNAILRLRYFPTRWKSADVIVFQKPGKAAAFPQHYRPISLLPSLSKIAEGIILSRLKELVGENHLIPDEQFGFQPQTSSVHQALRLVEFASEGFNLKMSTGVALFDVSKAFDKVWHEGLLFKLLEAGFPNAMVELIASYQQRRLFRVRVGISHSTERMMEAGLPQGSVLSPILYSLFTRDVPKTQGTNLALFADDTAIFARANQPNTVTRRLKQAIDNLQEWLATWRITVNPEKSKALFLSKRKHRPDEEIQLNGTPIPWTDKAKYLGVIIDRRLTWKSHIDHCTAKAKAAQSQIYPLINRRSKLSAATKIRLYKTIIRLTMTYASTVWGYAAKSHINKLQVVQN